MTGAPRRGVPSEDQIHVRTHSPLLGTVVEIRVETVDEDLAAEADRRAVAEIERLQQVFNAFDEGSELAGWRRGSVAAPGPELTEVLQLALHWQRRSGGALNPLSDVLAARWHRAEIDGEPPEPGELQELAASIHEPRYDLVDGVPVRRGDCSRLQLNALAKGYIVDRAVAAAQAAGALDSVTVNAGGDLLHRGEGVVQVGVEDPHRPYDNEPPLTSVHLHDLGLATSGGSRRGFRIGGRRYGHVIDPWTGATADAIASITVVAGDAVRADAIATCAGVLAPTDAVDSATSFGAVGCLVVDRDGTRRSSAGWRAIEVG